MHGKEDVNLINGQTSEQEIGKQTFGCNMKRTKKSQMQLDAFL